nr:site-2 protease family protein [Mycolicibacter acidiphilus]
MSAHPVRPSPIFLGLIALTALGGVLAWRAADEVHGLAYTGVFVFVIAGWLVSLCLHEFGHAYTAWRFGDHGVAMRGYLTLNPLHYSHPGLSLVLPLVVIALGGIGLPGGAVFVQTGFMTPRRQSIVSMAGPAANLVLGVALLISTQVFYDPAHPVFFSALAFLGFLQLTALVLNLLPIPGLDGYGALQPHLSPATRRAVQPFERWGLLVVLVLLISSPAINRWFFSLVLWFFDLFGVPRMLVSWGMSLTQFWNAWL